MYSQRNMVIGAVLTAFVAVSAVAAPKTGYGTTSWQLEVEFHDPQRLNLRLPGETAPRTYWYMLYRATNATGKDRAFFPSVRLVTDTLQVVEAGANISPHVYDFIIARHKREYPFLVPPAKATGLLLQGKENGRASVAVFAAIDPQASSFTIYAGGFSGEMLRIPNPAFDPKQDASETNERFFVLRRTLATKYDLPGDPATRDNARPIRRTREWVMR